MCLIIIRNVKESKVEDKFVAVVCCCVQLINFKSVVIIL